MNSYHGRQDQSQSCMRRLHHRIRIDNILRSWLSVSHVPGEQLPLTFVQRAKPRRRPHRSHGKGVLPRVSACQVVDFLVPHVVAKSLEPVQVLESVPSLVLPQVNLE